MEEGNKRVSAEQHVAVTKPNKDHNEPEVHKPLDVHDDIKAREELEKDEEE